jgi:hypothetical protein
MSKNMNGIIAFCGAKGAGKDTSYAVLEEVLPGKVERVALADQLKKVCSKVFDIDMKYFTDPSLKEVDLEEKTIVVDRAQILGVLDGFDLNNGDPLNDKGLRFHIGKTCTTPRQLLQFVGTDLLHPVDDLIHVKRILDKRDPSKLTVITDLRFETEFNYFFDNLAASEFTPIYVKNPKAEMIASTDLHPSERQLDIFKNKCHVLMNDGDSLSSLRVNLEGLFTNIYGEDYATIRKS